MPAEIKTVNVKAILEEYGRILQDALATALPRESHATGDLQKSIKFTVKPFGLTYTFTLTMADYWEYVDKGRRPGKMPPVAPLIKWIADKHLIFNNNKIGRGKNDKKSKLALISNNFSLQTKLAWAFARGIAKRGTKGTHFFSNTVPDWKERLKVELPKALKRDILIQFNDL